MLLELQGVDKHYGAVHALKAMDLSSEPGSIGLLGPNGAGKSTLLKILLGLVRPTAGSVRVLGEDPSQRSLELRQRIGYMPENDCYIAKLDAVDTCAYAGELCGLPPAEARQRANAVLEYTGLGDKRYLKVQAYSTGQRQRVKLAQALVHDPDLLLLDEPTNGLDPQGRDEMLTLIKQLPERRGCSVILSSHLLRDVEAVCERVIVLDQGELIHHGGIDAMQGKDSDYYQVRAKSKAETQTLRAALEAGGCQAVMEEDGGMLQVRVAPGDDADAILRLALDAEVQVRHLERRKSSFEDAFLDVLAQRKAVVDKAATAASANADEANS